MIKEREKKHRINFCRSHRHPPAGRLRPTRAVGARVAGGAPGTEAASGPASRGAPQINQKLPGAGRTRTRAAPALRHSMARRRVVSRRRLALAGRPVRRSALRPSPNRHFHSIRVAHPSRTPPISSIPRRGPAPPTFRTINFGDVAASVFRSYHIGHYSTLYHISFVCGKYYPTMI